jgi:hypothetical protein
LRSRVRRRQDATLEELRAHLEEQAGPAVSVSTVSRALIRLNLGSKKSLAAGERNNYKRGWFRRRARRVNHRRLVFVDETAVNTAMTRRYGRAPRGERVYECPVPNPGMLRVVSGVNRAACASVARWVGHKGKEEGRAPEETRPLFTVVRLNGR